jgi:type I restriction enzyme, S subunit
MSRSRIPFVRLGYLATIQSGITVDANRDHGSDSVTLPYLRVANVQDGHLDLRIITEIRVPRTVARSATLRRGDVLMTEGGDLDKLGRGTIWNGEIVNCLHQNHVFAIRPDRSRLLPEYLALITQTSYARAYFESTGTRTTNLASTSSSKIRDFRIPFVNLDEQRRIIDFLGTETSRIDALTQTYEGAKSTIGERVQCLLDLLVDGAGNLVPLKYFVRFREGPGIMAVDFRDEGTPLIRISGLQDRVVTLNGANYLDDDMVAARWPQFRLRLGDYLISGSATMGAVSVVKDPGIVGAIPYTGLIILRPALSEVVMEYVAVALTSRQFTRQIDLLKAGATMQHFGPTHLAQVSLPFPDRQRQVAIASAVGEVWEQSSRTAIAIDRQLALLAERRQALITAAVTGQMDVTTARGADV